MSAATDYIQLTHAASEIDGTIDEVYAARGSYGNLSLKIASKQDELTQSQLAAANSGVTAEKLTADEAALDWNVNQGVKNLLNPVLTDTSVYGVTATLNDGVITLNGKSTNSSGSTLRIALYPAGSTWLSGCILSGIPVNSEGVYMNLEKSGSPYTQYAHDTGNGAKIGTLPNDEIFIIFIRVPYNVQLTKFEVKPMIRHAFITDSTFQPYALSNPVITPALIEQVDSGAKNLSTVNSVTNQQDYIDINVNLKAGKYIISAGSISTTSSDTSIRIGLYKRPNNLLYTYIDVGSNKYSEFEISGDADIVRVFATNSSSVSSGKSLTFSDLMICTLADWNVSHKFVPYCPSLQRMWEMIQELQNGTRSAPALALAKAEPEEIKEPETGEEEMR